jgi:hypothetical protein
VTRGRSVLNCIQYILLYSIISFIINHFSGVMVSVLIIYIINYNKIVSECVIVVIQLYHGENKLIFNEMMMRSALY